MQNKAIKDSDIKSRAFLDAKHKIRSLKKDIGLLQSELDFCIKRLRENCDHSNVISKMVFVSHSLDREGNHDIREPYSFCVLCGESEAGWGGLCAKLPEGRTLSTEDFETEYAKALRELYHG